MKKNKILSMRVSPTQKRARETVELILDTALELIKESGTDALTTKLIAERASIRIRNVYRYFPNKIAVICELGRRMAEKEAEYVDHFSTIANPKIDLGRALDTTVDSFFDSVLQQPGIIPIRKAMKSIPELKAIDEQSNRELADQLAKALKNRGEQVLPENLNRICTIVLTVSTVILDQAGEEITNANESQAGILLDELKKLLKAYLNLYI